MNSTTPTTRATTTITFDHVFVNDNTIDRQLEFGLLQMEFIYEGKNNSMISSQDLKISLIEFYLIFIVFQIL